jgi:hypothetical protein
MVEEAPQEQVVDLVVKEEAALQEVKVVVVEVKEEVKGLKWKPLEAIFEISKLFIVVLSPMGEVTYVGDSILRGVRLSFAPDFSHRH